MRLGPWLLLLLLGLLLLPTGWLLTDHLEGDDHFCISCHLRPGVRLHRHNSQDFDRRPPDSLAALHAKAGNEAHASTVTAGPGRGAGCA
jgi:hypothetical protein